MQWYFYKIFRPVFGYLRQQVREPAKFVDDSYLQVDIEYECTKCHLNASFEQVFVYILFIAISQ